MVRQRGAHRGYDAAVRRRRLGGGGELLWPVAPVGGPCSTRGPRRGDGRSTTRTTATGGVRSPKRGRNCYVGSNSDGSGGGFRRRRG
jgi:hypothetical protein